ncbi:MAG: hypothetical protein KF861_09135 [Planctomycetaceae bacterium]|nr:hypothetical protein [Planctomycetaceae bacterium]
MQRIILLGASNVTLGFPLIVHGVRASFSQPVQLFAAHGHGRSYGLRSRVLMRRLPGILDCGLWHGLDSQPSPQSRPLALITDVGNDLLYGVRPDMLLSWVAACVERLQQHGAAVTIATLPLASTLRMSAARYHATRMAFFPGGGTDWPTMRRMVSEVDAGLRELAALRSCRVVEPRGEWYGFDPIHVRRRDRVAAWSAMLSGWPEIVEIRMTACSPVRGLPYWRLSPAERELWGRTRHAAQPAHQDGDGSSIWLY